MTDYLIRPETPSEQSVDFEQVLQLVGSNGKYQRRFLWLLIVPITSVCVILSMNQVFLLSTPTHWCSEPTVFSDAQLSAEEKRTLVNPLNTDPHGASSTDSCRMYNLNYSVILQDLKDSGMNVSFYVNKYSVNWTTVPCKYGWEYDRALYTRTATTNWNLICDDDYLPSLVYTLGNAGAAIGTLIFGAMCDRIGRKTACLAAVIISFVSSVLTVVFPWFYGFMIAQAICGTIYPSLYQVPLILLLEIVPPDGRTRANGASSFGWTLGLAAIPLFAWLTADWILFGSLCAALTIPFFLCFCLMSESPRWLITQGKFDEASIVLHQIAKTNGKDISNVNILTMLENCNCQEDDQVVDSNVSTVKLFKYSTLFRRLIFITVCWTAMNMTYNGFHINLKALYGNEFLNSFFLTLAEAPSYFLAWFMMESRLGRRWSNVFFLLLTAFVCLLPLTILKDWEVFSTVASLVGTFGTAASSMVIYQQAAEIFPTSIRGSGIGIAVTVSNIVAISTPSIMYMRVYGHFIPYSVLGVICLLAGVCAAFVPETLNESLPQGLEDGERFGKDKKFFSFAKPDKDIIRHSVSEDVLVPKDETLQRISYAKLFFNVKTIEWNNTECSRLHHFATK